MTGPDWTPVRARLEGAYRDLVAALDRVADRRDAFKLATQGIELLRRLNADLGRRRAGIARDIYESEAMTLAELGEQVGVKATRAKQLVDKANRDTAEEADDE